MEGNRHPVSGECRAPVRVQPDPEPESPPSTEEYSCVPPADGKLLTAVTRQPEPDGKRAEVTLAPEERRASG